MRSAVIGLGVIGKQHARILRERGELYAVCDVQTDRLSPYGDVICETSFIRLLDEHKPDVVHICTPHYLHADMVIEALKRNIHVLCEKPMCIRTEDIDRILQAERGSTAMLGVCHQNRFNPENRFVKEYLRDKSLVGGVGYVAWHRTAEYYGADAWRGKWETEGGGVLINQALHTLDLLLWFLGDPEQITASICNLTLADSIEVEDTATLLCQGKSGFTFYATNGAPHSFPVYVTLTTKDKHTVTLLPHAVLIDGEYTDLPAETKEVYGKPCYGKGHVALIQDFYDCIATGRHFEIDGKEGARVVRLILAAYRSQGHSISL